MKRDQSLRQVHELGHTEARIELKLERTYIFSKIEWSITYDVSIDGKLQFPKKLIAISFLS